MIYGRSSGKLQIPLFTSSILFRIFSSMFDIPYLSMRNIKPIKDPPKYEQGERNDQSSRGIMIKDLYAAAERGDTVAQIASFMILTGIFILIRNLYVNSRFGACLSKKILLVLFVNPTHLSYKKRVVFNVLLLKI